MAIYAASHGSVDVYDNFPAADRLDRPSSADDICRTDEYRLVTAALDYATGTGVAGAAEGVVDDDSAVFDRDLVAVEHVAAVNSSCIEFSLDSTSTHGWQLFDIVSNLKETLCARLK